ncbi:MULTISPECIES: rhomboid family intramembrane serine protease [unclassified Streptomyces]|uniref:rhomboid family intramembrane serine protease n=1 Tax=unclassified Streptomyces TaxID=2593676 RepID=UPI00225933FA|nr:MULTISPECIES: rhomboid family intramembrane serine protease [unclassified Streptomyces]MCX5012896.1 rhomboid family intramembrane serine protease [Streptomyces sp. NBC_00555]MCX5606872.1 rhomboid family intramembrane serine protease [Streptomyces sp. NBC_00047]
MDTDRLPGCYRHPDRDTGISCTRCERPICPECMISASVGFQCPECVREGSGTGHRPTANAPRTLAGGVVAADPQLVTKILIGINAAVFLAGLAAPAIVVRLELLGRYVEFFGAPVEGVSTGQYYRLLTSVFLHVEWWHIIGNMIGLWVIGGPLEAALGRSRYLAVYLLSGLGASAFVYLLTEPNTPTLGASGAVFGLLGATVVLARRLRYEMRPVIVMVVLMLALTFVPLGGSLNVSWQAHVGGLVTGALVGLGMLRPAAGRNRTLIQWGTCVVVFLLAAAVILLRTAELT